MLKCNSDYSLIRLFVLGLLFMKKILGIIVLGLLLSTDVYAKLIKIAGNSETEFYYYNESVTKESIYLYTWILGDNITEPDGISNRSYKAHLQMDCNLKRFKVHNWIYYTEPMGGGDLDNFVADKIHWISASPGSSWEALITRICNIHK